MSIKIRCPYGFDKGASSPLCSFTGGPYERKKRIASRTSKKGAQKAPA